MLNYVQVREAAHILDLLGTAPLLKLAAAIAGSGAMAGALHMMRHPLALPAMLVAIPAIFYAYLAASGISLQTARDAGWVAQLEVGSIFSMDIAINSLGFTVFNACLRASGISLQAVRDVGWVAQLELGCIFIICSYYER
jgi:hypothetical protein